MNAHTVGAPRDATTDAQLKELEKDEAWRRTLPRDSMMISP